MIGVNLDDDLVRAEKFARTQDVQFQLLISAPENTGRDYRVDRVPMTVFVDRAGRAARGAPRIQGARRIPLRARVAHPSERMSKE